MASFKTEIGKVRKINHEEGVGEIVSQSGNYMFLLNDIGFNTLNLKEGDTVKFRAEKIQDYNRAFFVDKIILEKDYLNNKKEYKPKKY